MIMKTLKQLMAARYGEDASSVEKAEQRSARKRVLHPRPAPVRMFTCVNGPWDGHKLALSVDSVGGFRNNGRCTNPSTQVSTSTGVIKIGDWHGYYAGCNYTREVYWTDVDALST
jgi:hypothetical protein